MLTEKEQKRIKKIRRLILPTIIFAVIAILAGGYYGIWSVDQLNKKNLPNPDQDFDRPIAQIGATIQTRIAQWSKANPASTPRELAIMDHLTQTNDYLAVFATFSFRLLFSLFLMTLGLVWFTSGLTWYEAFKLMNKSQDSES